MCLQVDGGHMAIPKIATKDIVCYKKCDIYNEEPMPWSIKNPFFLKKLYFYKTPYYCMHIELGETYESTLKKSLDGGNIEEGLHTFAESDQQLNLGQVLIECVIPVGATYYEGVGLWRAGYASDKLRYVKIIKTKKNNITCV